MTKCSCTDGDKCYLCMPDAPPAAKPAFHVFTKSSEGNPQKHYLIITKNEATALDHILDYIEGVSPRPQISIEPVVRVRFEESNDEMYSL